jgi:hypothetical protein
MINIYAKTFMTATRLGEVPMQDVPSVPKTKRKRWFSRRKVRLINPLNL